MGEIFEAGSLYRAGKWLLVPLLFPSLRTCQGVRFCLNFIDQSFSSSSCFLSAIFDLPLHPQLIPASTNNSLPCRVSVYFLSALEEFATVVHFLPLLYRTVFF